MKKLYIAGCGGMLGDAFYHTFKDDYQLKCSDIDVNSEWLSYLDFRNFDEYLNDVLNFKPDFLLHLGAITDLECCELHPQDAYDTNTLSADHAIEICIKLDIPLLYISTAGIFDGQKDQYHDWDIPNPLCVYASTKYQGEKLAQEKLDKYLICRPGWMMGGGPSKDKKFIQKIMAQLKNGATELFIVDDKLGTPTYTYDFAANVKLLMESNLWGLYNMACQGVTSRIEVARELLKILGLEKKIKITPVSSTYWSETYFAKRPDSERLLNSKLEQANMNVMRDWKICLNEYIENHYYDYLVIKP